MAEQEPNPVAWYFLPVHMKNVANTESLTTPHRRPPLNILSLLKRIAKATYVKNYIFLFAAYFFI
jgi:hypothetical protein